MSGQNAECCLVPLHSDLIHDFLRCVQKIPALPFTSLPVFSMSKYSSRILSSGPTLTKATKSLCLSTQQ